VNLLKFLDDTIQKSKKERVEKKLEMARVTVTPSGLQYSFVEKNLGDGQIRMGLRIHSGPHRGIIFTTSPKITFDEQEDGTCRMNFGFTVEKLPINLDKSIIEDPALKKDVGDIILDVIDREYSGSENKNNNANRGSNPIGAGE
jgi:hypothetical protein